MREILDIDEIFDREKYENALSSIMIVFSNKKLLYIANCWKSRLEIDTTDACTKGGCFLTQCESCINSKKIDFYWIWNEILKEVGKKGKIEPVTRIKYNGGIEK